MTCSIFRNMVIQGRTRWIQAIGNRGFVPGSSQGGSQSIIGAAQKQMWS
jgi:hypothetical protein